MSATHKHELRIPEGSRLQRYLDAIPHYDDIRKDVGKLFSYLEAIFSDCMEFINQDTEFTSPPYVGLRLVGSSEKYKEKQQEIGNRAIIKEEAKTQDYAFCVGNAFGAEVFVDLQFFLSLWEKGSSTFLINIVLTYFHEILHACSHSLDEDEVFKIECQLVEKFLGIKLPKEVKSHKASEYYYKEKQLK